MVFTNMPQNGCPLVLLDVVVVSSLNNTHQVAHQIWSLVLLIYHYFAVVPQKGQSQGKDQKEWKCIEAVCVIFWCSGAYFKVYSFK